MTDAPPPAGLRRIERLLALAVFVSAGYFLEHELSVNANAHMDQCHAIVSSGRLAIDGFIYRAGQPSFPGATVDYSAGKDGRAYSNKAPGLSFLAVPVYAPLYWAERVMGIDPLGRATYLVNRTIVNLLTNGLLAAVGAVALLRAILAFGLPLAPALYGTVAVVAGTMYLPYAAAFYSHTPAAALVAIALRLAVAARPAGVGAALGAAVLVDYTAVFAAVPIAACCAVQARGRPREIGALALGALPFLAAFLIHNHAVYGHPLATPYATINPEHLSPTGSNFETPTPGRFWALLLGLKRGLFYFSPPLLLAVPGARLLGRERLAEVLTAVAVFAGALVFNASLHAWHGGGTTGPRYMIPALPVLGPLVAAGAAAFPTAAMVALAYAVVNHLGILAVGHMCPAGVGAPLLEYVYPALIQGDPRRDSLGVLAGLTRAQALVPVIAFWTAAGVLLDRASAVALPGQKR